MDISKDIEEKKKIEENEKKENKTEQEIEENIKNEKKDDSRSDSEKEEKINKKETIAKIKTRKFILLIILTVLIIITLSTIFALININNSKILEGISINGISVEGLTKEEARKKLENEYSKIEKQEINIKAADFEYQITAEQIEPVLKIDEAIEFAYNIGRNGNVFSNNFNIIKTFISKKNVEMEIEYSTELLETIINNINAKLPNALIDNEYSVEEDKLIIKKGTAGNVINKDNLKEQILNVLKEHKTYTIQLETSFVKPDEINIDKIYDDVYTEPKNAYYQKEPFQVFAHVIGIDFDKEEAKKILEQDLEEYEIPLKITLPEITTDKIGSEAFPDLLSSFTTKYDASLKDRSTNLRLATESLNGKVVMPGETFSYNKALGERTVTKGYKEGAGYAGGKVVQTLGGGICQISSTLYDAVVYANLEIEERYNHAFLTSYVGAGKDATVVYGSLDFKFKNTRKYPIMIKASAKSGIARIEIYGMKEETEYKIEIESKILSYIPYKVIYEDNSSMGEGTQKVTQNGMNGCKSITYKIYKVNGTEVKRETLSTDTYSPMNKYITRGTKPITVQTNVDVQQPEEKQNSEEIPKSENENQTTVQDNLENAINNVEGEAA